MTDASVIPKETSLWRWGQCCCFTCLEWALKERRSMQGPQQVKRRLSNTHMSKASSEQELGGLFAALILFAFEVQIDGLCNRAFELAMITAASVYFPCDTWTYCIARLAQDALMAVVQVGCLAQTNVDVASLRGWSGKVKYYGCLLMYRYVMICMHIQI